MCNVEYINSSFTIRKHSVSFDRNEISTFAIKMFKILFALFAILAVISSSTFAKKLVCNMPNEEYHCGSPCQTTCANLGLPCPIVNIKCNDACYCKDGYARNSNGICIPIKACASRRRNSKHNRVPLPYV